jgi:hypothetical protein
VGHGAKPQEVQPPRDQRAQGGGAATARQVYPSGGTLPDRKQGLCSPSKTSITGVPYLW